MSDVQVISLACSIEALGMIEKIFYGVKSKQIILAGFSGLPAGHVLIEEEGGFSLITKRFSRQYRCGWKAKATQ